MHSHSSGTSFVQNMHVYVLLQVSQHTCMYAYTRIWLDVPMYYVYHIHARAWSVRIIYTRYIHACHAYTCASNCLLKLLTYMYIQAWNCAHTRSRSLMASSWYFQTRHGPSLRIMAYLMCLCMHTCLMIFMHAPDPWWYYQTCYGQRERDSYGMEAQRFWLQLCLDWRDTHEVRMNSAVICALSNPDWSLLLCWLK